MNLSLTTLAAYFHTLDPIVVQLGPLAIRWYGLSYVAGFVMAYFTLRWLARRGAILIPEHRISDALLILILGVLIGGRVGYAAFGYDPSLLWTFRSSFPFWDLLAIQRGGMSSHGGIVGVILASVYISRGFRNPDGTIEGRCSWRHVVDMIALCAPLGFFFGRIANFINGELLGKIITMPGEAGAPWYAVKFPQELLGWETPTLHDKHTPDLTVLQQEQLFRLVSEQAKPDERWGPALEHVVSKAGQYQAQLEPLVSARHPSQLYAALLEGLAVGLVVWFIARLPRKAGVVGAWWLVAYGIARIIGEIWRLPDAQFEIGRPLGLSRGQWLSVAMVVAGGAVLVWLRRKSEQTVGGWLRTRT